MARTTRFLSLILLSLLAAALWAAPVNVILLIGDGMGPDVVAATGAYQYGADYHMFGGNKRLALETLANRYYATTYSTSGAGYDFTWEEMPCGQISLPAGHLICPLRLCVSAVNLFSFCPQGHRS